MPKTWRTPSREGSGGGRIGLTSRLTRIRFESVIEAAKRERLIQAATATFTTHGFKKASIDVSARVARVAKGTVYLACESKADLFYQTILRDLRGWIAQCAKMIDPRLPADELLVQSALN